MATHDNCVIKLDQLRKLMLELPASCKRNVVQFKIVNRVSSSKTAKTNKMDFDYSNSDNESEKDYDLCRVQPSNSYALPFDPVSLENIILDITDKFNFQVIWNNKRTKTALLVTTGLAVAGGLIGKHYGGKMGAALGGAVGGACGVGIVVVTMRDIWQDIKSKLADLFDLVYDYLAGLGLEDYKKAAYYLIQNGGCAKQLGMLILQTSTELLGKKILSSLTPSLS